MSNVKNVRKKNLQKKKKNKNDNYNQFFIPLLPSHPCHRKKQRTSLYAKKNLIDQESFPKIFPRTIKFHPLKKSARKHRMNPHWSIIIDYHPSIRVPRRNHTVKDGYLRSMNIHGARGANRVAGVL